MTKKEIEDKVDALKMDYIRIQGDLEKLDSVGGNTANGEKQLELIENEIAELKKQLETI